jgi:peptide chain release factor 1
MDQKEHNLRAEFMQLQLDMQNPDVFGRSNYPEMAKRQGELAKVIGLFDDKKNLQKQLAEAEKISSSSDIELAELAKSEIDDLKQDLAETELALADALTPKDPNDDRNAVIEIRAAAGGDESALFAGDLYRMYIRWAEKHSLKSELISESPSETGGFKEIVFMIKGEDAYRHLKFEAGVHRVQRIPVTESQGRIHTSTTTVAVMPEAEEKDIEVKDSDLRIDVFRSGGHGGQSVNTTDSAVRITHLPTGLVVANQDEKSQIKNKAKALSVLRSRLLQMKIDEEQKEMSDARKKLIGSGDRSEKIRTYNYPQDRITDHRIGYSRSNLPGALDGDIDDIIQKLLDYEHQLISDEG